MTDAELDRENVWAEMAIKHPTFLPEYDIANNHHAIREIVLGGSPPWAGVHRQFTPFDGARVMDIGANTGVFSIYCALHGADVTAYEPHAEISIELARLIANKKLSINLIPAAIWCENGEAKFLSHESRIDDSAALRFNGSVQSDGINWTPDDKNRAASVFCRSFANAIGQETWHMVKMDIEGAECETILGTPIESLRRIHFMYLELHPWVSEQLYQDTLNKLQEVFHFEGAYFNDEINRWEGVYLHGRL